MGLANSYWELLRYKIHHIGVRNTLRVAYLDLSEDILCRVAKRFPSFSISPRSVQIECTTRCNLKCTMCEISYWTEKGGDLELTNLRRMIEHLPRLQRVDLTGIGEALMNRSFFDALKFLKSRRLYVTLNDNFTLMTEKTSQQIIELGVDQIFFSVDGASPETYEQIRVGAKFDKVVGNVRRLIQMKREMRAKRPEVKINTVVCSNNYHELPAIVELAHDIGIGMVQFVNVIAFDSTLELDTRGMQREVRLKFQEALQVARRLGVLVKIELFDKLPVRQCTFPWKRNFVTYDGYVHPCCYTTQTGDRAAQNKRSFGNLISNQFRDIWDSATYRVLRKKMLEGILPHACEHCPKYFGKPDRQQQIISGEQEAREVRGSKVQKSALNQNAYFEKRVRKTHLAQRMPR